MGTHLRRAGSGRKNGIWNCHCGDSGSGIYPGRVESVANKSRTRTCIWLLGDHARTIAALSHKRRSDGLWWIVMAQHLRRTRSVAPIGKSALALGTDFATSRIAGSLRQMLLEE